MRWWLAIALVACKSEAPPAPAPIPTSVPKPPDELDEKMRHCPLALAGATASIEDLDGGVRFTITAPAPTAAELRRRAHHVVEFAARKTRQGHGDFDGKGGGRMKNCPVVTDAVAITATDIDGGARLDVRATGDAAALRTETRARAASFAFEGATLTLR